MRALLRSTPPSAMSPRSHGSGEGAREPERPLDAVGRAAVRGAGGARQGGRHRDQLAAADGKVLARERFRPATAGARTVAAAAGARPGTGPRAGAATGRAWAGAGTHRRAAEFAADC